MILSMMMFLRWIMLEDVKNKVWQHEIGEN